MKKEEINKNSFYKTTEEGVEVKIHAFPNSRKNIIEKVLFKDANNETYIKIRVTTVPEDGKANKAIIKLLSKEFDIPKSKMHITRGEKNSKKTVEFNISEDDFLVKASSYFKWQITIR